MTTHVLVATPEKNHKRVRVRLLNMTEQQLAELTIQTEYVLGDLESFDGYVYEGRMLLIDEVD